MKTVVMSGLYPQFCEALSQKGYHIILSKKINTFPEPEQYHADMQLLNINGELFTLQECRGADQTVVTCEKPAGKRYPENVLLNALFIGGCVYANEAALDSSVKRFCREQQIPIINVKQGYARCSVLVLNEHAAVTADKSLYRALTKNGVEVLPVSSGHIRLEGFDYGFIGGASGKIDDTIFFFGNIKEHPDYESIRMFCKKHQLKTDILCPDLPLTDIGGLVVR